MLLCIYYKDTRSFNRVIRLKIILKWNIVIFKIISKVKSQVHVFH